jgi:hypothetical protein
MRAWIFAAFVLGAPSVSPAAWAGAPMERLPIECDPSFGSSGTDTYQDSRGPQYSGIGDAFPSCLSAELWNGIGRYHDEGPFTHRDNGEITSDGTSVTVLVEIELGFPPDAFAMLEVSMFADGLVHAPPPSGPGPGLAPATLVMEIERSGLVDLPPSGMWVRMMGPGVDLWPGPDALPDGVHEFDTFLEAGASYSVDVGVTGALDTNGSGSQRITVYVLAAEPATPLLLLAGAAAFGLRSVLYAHRMRAQRRGVRLHS